MRKPKNVRFRGPIIIHSEEPNVAKITRDIPLMRQVVNDLEYGVTSRPNTPACFEEESELGVVDSACDIRHSQWDTISESLQPKFNSTKVAEPEPSPVNVDTTE